MVVQYSITKWDQFLKYLLPYGKEWALAPSATSGIYVKGYIGENPRDWDCYQDNTAPTPSAKAGYTAYDLFLDSGSGWEMLRDDSSHPIFTIDGTYNLTGLPKDQTVTQPNQPAFTSLGFFRWLYAPTGLDVTRMRNFANQFQRGTINQQLAYQRFATKEQRRIYYLNDLMNHKQPFGPTHRQK